MPCHAAIEKKSITLKADTTIEKALKELKKAKVEYAPVLDGGVLVGLFSYQILMKNLVPVSVNMGGGVQMDVNISAAPGIAKRLKNSMLLTVDTMMERKSFPVVFPSTPTWEGVNMMVQTGLPLTVVDPETQKYVGFISQTSLLEELQRLQESD